MPNKCRDRTNNYPLGDGCHVFLTQAEISDIAAVLSGVLQILIKELKKPGLMEAEQGVQEGHWFTTLSSDTSSDTQFRHVVLSGALVQTELPYKI